MHPPRAGGVRGDDGVELPAKLPRLPRVGPQHHPVEAVVGVAHRLAALHQDQPSHPRLEPRALVAKERLGDLAGGAEEEEVVLRVVHGGSMPSTVFFGK